MIQLEVDIRQSLLLKASSNGRNLRRGQREENLKYKLNSTYWLTLLQIYVTKDVPFTSVMLLIINY